MKKTTVKLFALLLGTAFLHLNAHAQDGEATSTEYAASTFKDSRIVNGHSVEMSVPGQLKFTISHRFGEVRTGWRELWGLDDSSIRFGFDYGLTDFLTVGFGRSSVQKTFDGSVKLRMLRQSSGARNFPFTLVYIGSTAVNSTEWANPERENYFTSRMFYTNQLLLARKFGDGFSLQLMPTHVHRNLVATSDVSHDIFSIGGATRIQLTKAIALNVEYYQNLEELEGRKNSLGVGFDIETKGHFFQLHVTNSRGMIAKNFITETTTDFFDGGIHIGFNISRTFVLRGRKHNRERRHK